MPNPTCNFCHKPSNEVKNLIANGDSTSHICDSCLESAFRVISEAKQKKASTKEAVLHKPKEIKAFLDKHVIGQEGTKKDLAVAVYNHYKRREASKLGQLTFDGPNGPEPVEIEKSNVILMGPTGSGKTFLAKTIAKYLNVPFFVADCTRLTQAGYVGDDVESILQGLLAAANGDLPRAEWGIVFLDEFDKMSRKSGRGATGYRDVNGEGVQQALLKLLEGAVIPVPRGQGKTLFSGGPPADLINTSNILFIGAGSFAGIEDTVGGRINSQASMGFGGTMKKKDIAKNSIYKQITVQDILEFGMIPELVGRMPVLTSTYELEEDVMVRILTEPQNALLKQYSASFALDKIRLEFDPEALKLIAQKAMKRELGARALKSIVEEVVSPYSYEAPSDPSIEAIRITEEAVKEPGKAEITRKVMLAAG